jgi:hypothetical protein
MLHRQLSSHLTRTTFDMWRPTLERNLERLRNGVTGQPHTRHLELWRSLVEQGDVLGLLSNRERLEVLDELAMVG